MSKPDLSVRELDLIRAVLASFPEVEQAVLFGSRAMGRSTPGSDVDIALRGTNLSRKTVTMISYKLNEEFPLPYHFDVLNEHTITNPDLRDHIDRVGFVVFCADENDGAVCCARPI